MDDFRTTAASGLDEIQQVVNPHEDPDPTLLPDEVAFPWMISPDAYGNEQQQKAKPKSAASKHSDDDDLPIFRMGDQPTTCPECGRRSQFTEEPDGSQIHSCNQGHRFRVVDDGEDGDDDDHDDHRHAARSSRDCTNGNHSSCSTQTCGCNCHSSKSNRSGACAEGDHGDCKMGSDCSCKCHTKTSTRKQADMYGNSDLPHDIAQPGVANNSGTTPNPSAGYSDGVQDAQDGDHPTYADASSSVPEHVQQYSKGYSDGVQARQPSQQPVPSMAQASKQAAGCSANHVYNEQYGDITRPQQAAYRKHNVSPSDHDALVDRLGEHAHKHITNTVEDPRNHLGHSYSNQLSDLHRRHGRAARPVVLQGHPLAPAPVRQGLQDHPQAPRGDLGGHRARSEQRQSRRTEQPRPPDHPPGLRVPLRPRRARPGDALLRTDNPAPTPRTQARMIHTHAGVCPERKVMTM